MAFDFTVASLDDGIRLLPKKGKLPKVENTKNRKCQKWKFSKVTDNRSGKYQK